MVEPMFPSRFVKNKPDWLIHIQDRVFEFYGLEITLGQNPRGQEHMIPLIQSSHTVTRYFFNPVNSGCFKGKQFLFKKNDQSQLLKDKKRIFLTLISSSLIYAKYDHS